MVMRAPHASFLNPKFAVIIVKRLLIVYHSRSGHTASMAEAAIAGARDPEVSGVDVVVRDALAAEPADVLACDAIIIGTPENFGYMSGAIKMFFETIYYPCLEHTQGLPYALVVRAGNDGQGALTSMQRIITGLRWREVAPAVIAAGEFDPACRDDCRELGMSLAAGLEAGIF